MFHEIVTIKHVFIWKHRGRATLVEAAVNETEPVASAHPGAQATRPDAVLRSLPRRAVTGCTASGANIRPERDGDTMLILRKAYRR